MPIINDFSDCCMEFTTVVPSSLLSSPSAPASAWHRVSERVQRRLRFILRGPAHLTPR